jgi:hypothetical protein
MALTSLSPDQPTNNHWFDEPKNNVHNAVKAAVAFLEHEQSGRLTTINRNVRLYNNALASPYQGNPDYTATNSFPGVARESRISINVCKSCVDTAASKIAKNKIKPTLLTDGADWDTQRKAEQLDKSIRGHWQKANVHAVTRKAFIDAAVTGTGVIKIINGKDDISYERVLCTYLLVDDLEAIHGNPRSMFQYHYVDRSQLLSMYSAPAKREAIATANSYRVTGMNSKSDIVRVYEAWRLPSGNQPGRHCICLDNYTLLDEEWVDKEFPFVFFKWSKPSVGFWGQSLIDELNGIQMEISKIMYFIQQSVHLGHAPKWLVSNQSQIPGSHLNNQIGTIIKYNGQIPPQYVAPNPISDQVFRYIDWLIQQAYRITGISELSARSEKPAGLNSGKAMQTYNDIETQRFVLVGQEFEDMHVSLYFRTVEACKRSAKNNPEFSIPVYSKVKGSHKVPWADIDLDIDDQVVEVFPTSMLPHSPEGRLAMVEELLAAGKIDDDFAMELLDFPDVSAYKEIRMADTYAIRDALADIVEKGEYKPPEEFDNLEKALDIAHRTYLRMRSKGAPEDVLALVRQYMADCKALMDEITQAAAPLPTQQPTPVVAGNVPQMTPALPMAAPAAPVAPVPPPPMPV